MWTPSLLLGGLAPALLASAFAPDAELDFAQPAGRFGVELAPFKGRDTIVASGRRCSPWSRHSTFPAGITVAIFRSRTSTGYRRSEPARALGDHRHANRERLTPGRPRSALPVIRLPPALAPWLPALLVAGCGNSPTDGSDPVYFAVAYGVVQEEGTPVSGLEVRGEVFTSSCPASGQASQATTRSGLGGAYRLLLTSFSPAAGQCLRLTSAPPPGPPCRTA